jgi:hypothetical protein
LRGVVAVFAGAVIFALASIGATVTAAAVELVAVGAMVVLMAAGASMALAGVLETGVFSVLFMWFFQ